MASVAAGLLGCTTDRIRDSTCTCPPGPPSECLSAEAALHFEPTGPCVVGHECTYAPRTEACTGGASCVDGACTSACAQRCAGCCQGEVCVPVAGELDRACGLGGASCFECGVGFTCTNGACVDDLRPHGTCDGGPCPAPRDRRLALGACHSCVLFGDGGVSCWGNNSFGQLGAKAPGQSARPMHVAGLPPMRSLSMAYLTSCATAANTDEVWCWGEDAPFTRQASGDPRPDAGLISPRPLQQLGTGWTNYFLMHDGGISGWGLNVNLEVGGRRGFTDTPRFILGGANELAVGEGHACAIVDAEVFCWGGGPGVSGTHQAFAPVQVPLPAPAVELSAWQSGSCALLATGDVWCWGDNSGGQLGRGTFAAAGDYYALPEGVVRTWRGARLASGRGFGGPTCVVTDEAQVWCWGYMHVGSLGEGTLLSPVPVHVVDLDDALEVAVGGGRCRGPTFFDAGTTVFPATFEEHVCALRLDGGVRCWGDNQYGQLGDGTTVTRSFPVDVIF